MPNGLGSFGPSFASSTLIPAIPSATITGIAQGIQNGFIKSLEIIEKCNRADDILKTIQKSIKEFNNSEFRDIDGEFSGLNIFKDSLNGDDLKLFPVVDFTRQRVATVPATFSEGIGSVVSHGMQTIADIMIGSKVAMTLACNQPYPNDIWQPSKLKENAKENFSACCKYFMEHLGSMEQDLQNNIKKDFIPEGNSLLDSHQTGAMFSAGATLAVSTGAPSVVASLLWDTVGVFLRNLQASGTYIKNSSEVEAKVSEATSQCLKSMSQNQPSKESCFESLERLNQLIDVLTNVNRSMNQTSNDLVTDAQPISKLLSFATVPFISTLKLVVNSALGCLIASEVTNHHLNVPESKVLSQRASSLEDKKQDQQNSNFHSQNIRSLTEQFRNINQALSVAVAQEQKLKGGSDASSALSAGIAATLTHSVFLLLPLLLIELGGFTQESAAGLHFSKKSSDQIFHQSDLVSQSGENVGEELDKLFAEAIKTRDALEMAKALGNSSPFSLGLTRASACGTAVGTLELLLGTYAAIKEFKSATELAKLSPQRSELNNEEKMQVAESVNMIKQSNQKASSALSTSAPKNVSAESGLESILKKVILIGCISQSDNAEVKERKDINSVGKVSIASENNSLTIGTRFGGFLTGILSATALASLESGITMEAILRAFGNTFTDILHSYQHIKECSEGPDKIKLSGDSGTNLSFLSNALRLLAASKFNDAPSAQSTVFSTAKSLETITSRSFTIFLIHSGILVDALRAEVLRHENPEDKTKSVRQTKAAAKEEVMSALGRIIEERLNNLDAKAIPGLNKDIAAQLQSFSQQRIVSALSTEMTLIEPFLVLSQIMSVASRNDALGRHDQEALMESTVAKQASVLSNMIQVFTLACVEEAGRTHDGGHRASLLQTHHSSRNIDKTTFMTSGYLSLSLVETIGTLVGRSFTLLNSEKVSQHSDEVTQLAKDELTGNINLSTAEVKAESRLHEGSSGTQSVSALRSTLTHLSAALKGCADELAEKFDKLKDEDFLKNDLQMHSQQKVLMKVVGSAFVTCASLITRSLAAGSGMSFSHIISLGKVDQLHDLLHSQDASLELRQGKSSQRSSRACGSDISIVTGLSTDLAVSSVTNLVKILLSASLMGADVLLSVSKILEILMLDVHPEVRLKQEIQALCVPDIKPQGASLASQRASKSSELIPTISTGQLSVSHADELLKSTLENSFLSLQNKVDQLINQMNVLEDSSSDDAKDNEINVKKYIFQVLKAMAPLLSDNECHSFIDRFNKGGITLSSYHSQLGGILNFSEEKEDVLLRSSFSNHRDMRHISNTNVLIEKFINYLFVEYLKFLKDETHTDPLKNFIETLAPELTTKTQGLHDYIIRAVANKVYESNNLVKATFWHSPRVAFNRDEFIALYSLPNPGILQASENTEPARRNEIESTLLQIEEARKRRRERRVATIVEEKPAGTNTQSNVSETNNEKESNIFRSGM